MSRVEALKRVLLAIPLIIYTYVGGAFAGIILLPLAALNILWQILTGNEGLLFNDGIARYFEWMLGNTVYVLTGNGDWEWTPL